MRAAGAVSAAITAARSSTSRATRRSTMRYGRPLSLGTRGLPHQAFHQLERLAFAPVLLAEGPVAGRSRCVHEEGHREPAHLPCLRRVLPRIEEHRERHFDLLEETVHR